MTPPRLGGDLLALASAAAWAWYGLAIGPVAARLGARKATAITMTGAMLAVTPLASGELTRLSWRSLSWRAWAGVVYGATLGMVVAMSLWARSAAKLGPRETVLYTYVEPASAVVIAAVVLGESFTVIQGVGACLAFAAVWVASRT